MPARLIRAASQENISSTLNGSISATATTITINDAAQFLSPSYAVIDRVDGTGTRRATSLWEYVYISGISGNDLTVTRAQGGSTGQTHSSGAVIEALPTAAMWEDFYSAWILEHSAVPGAHVSLASLSYLRTQQLVVTPSAASIAWAQIGTRLDASGASISGIQRTFVWFVPGTASAATTNAMRLITPFGGTFRVFTMATRTPVSTASLTVALYNIRTGASIFNTIGRPAILGGGTFVSTASINTPTFVSGDVIRMDIETGGNVADITLEGISY